MRFVSVSFALSFAICSFAQRQFVPGAYYDLKGQRLPGLLALPEMAYNSSSLSYRNVSNTFLFFKKDSLSEEIKLKGWKMKAFTMESDSFAVLRHIEVFDLSSTTTLPIAFCRIMVSDGKVILYNANFTEYVAERRATNASGPSPVYSGIAHTSGAYLIQQKGSEVIIPVELGIDEFITQMSHYFKLSDEIVNRIRNRDYSHSSTEQLVRDFNAWYANRKKSP